MLGEADKSIIAATGGAGAAWWLTAKEIALELFGVPLQVLFAAAVGALLARTFTTQDESAGYFRALVGSIAWALSGTILAQLMLTLLSAWLGKDASVGVLSGVAFLISGTGQFFAPVVVKEGPEALRRWLRNLANK